VTAAIASASAPVSVESAAAFAATVPGSEVARPVDADAAGAGAVFDAALSMLDTRTAGLAVARTAALLINGVDPVSAALAPFRGSFAFAAPAAVVRRPAEGFGVEFMLMAATEVFKPAAASEGTASEGAAAPCAMSVGASGVSMPPLFDAAVEAAAEGAAASPAATSAAAGCAVTPADPTGTVTAIDAPLDGGSEMFGAAGAGAATAVAERIGAARVGDPAAGDPTAGAPAAGGGGGKGDGEDLPATGRWPPLGSTPVGVCAVVLRLGFAPASFNALAKSWLWAPIAAEFAAAALI
jgi:hypothetical protein